MKRIVAIAIVVAAAAIVTRSGPPQTMANPPGTFSFGAYGDIPYYPMEYVRYPILLREIEANDLAFVIHVGDIMWSRCSDENYVKRRDRMNELRHPLIYTPGDNEWTDCWQPNVGSYRPAERLASLRRIFYRDPGKSLGRNPIRLAHQPGEFVENARWSHDGFTFATVHLVGSWNGGQPFAKRTSADDELVKRRTAAAVAWMRAAFAEARRTNGNAVVIAFHASWPETSDYRQQYEPFISALEEEAAQFAKPVLVIHGDSHEYIVDHPVPTAKNLTRLEVPGSPDVGWVRVTVTPRAPSPFTFESHVVPSWKMW